MQSEQIKNYLKANLHAHTYRCQHAYGTEREYVETAIEMGIKEFGFSDHIFCPFKNGEVSTMRMKLSEVEGYVDTLNKLKREYKNDIDILIGFEAEYIREFYEEQMNICREYDIDYLILGQHFIGTEFNGPYSGAQTTNEEILKGYVELAIEGAKTDSFTYMAHPDLIYYTGSKEIYYKHMRHLCEEMKKLNIPLEFNMLGKATNRNYPNEFFWQIAGEVGNKAIVGIDAHDTTIIQDVATYQECLALAKKFNIEVLPKAEEKKAP
ncbi:histidinol-phosphatase [Lachnobacterium bovis]|uniref:histidinol-phosphatase n=1 Tax=Lachnobacterium bovis TaxID=140626 RepID=UPI000552B481|nr:histidinol-phosphatase [Lachnobacterium bovis]